MVAGLNDAYRFWQTRFESSSLIVSSEVRSLSLTIPSMRESDALVRSEIALLEGGNPHQKILFIGNSPLPISAILMHLQTGLPVDCVALDSSVVPVSRQVVENCGFGSLVRIQDSADADYDVSGYDLVVVGLLPGARKPFSQSCGSVAVQDVKSFAGQPMVSDS